MKPKVYKLRRVRIRTLFRVALRTFCLQVVWNFQRMQNVGFAFALSPVLRVVYPARENRAKAFKRHLDFFVTHPYCASLILGVTARLEEEKVRGNVPDAMDANRIKTGMMGPLAALGDALFWATLKPSLALLGASVVLLSVPGRLWPAVTGPVIFLGLFTLVHLSVRIGGVYAGYWRGLEIIKDLRRVNPQKIAQHIGLFSAVVAGATAAGYYQIRSFLFWNSRVLDTALLGGLSLLFVMGLRRGISASRLFYLLLVLSILGGYLGLG